MQWTVFNSIISVLIAFQVLILGFLLRRQTQFEDKTENDLDMLKKEILDEVKERFQNKEKAAVVNEQIKNIGEKLDQLNTKMDKLMTIERKYYELKIEFNNHIKEYHSGKD